MRRQDIWKQRLVSPHNTHTRGDKNERELCSLHATSLLISVFVLILFLFWCLLDRSVVAVT